MHTKRKLLCGYTVILPQTLGFLKLYCLQEKKPLLPCGLELDAGLQQQVEQAFEQIMAKDGANDADLVAAQNKVQ